MDNAELIYVRTRTHGRAEYVPRFNRPGYTLHSYQLRVPRRRERRGGTVNGVNVLVERGGICKSYDCCFATAIAIALLFPKRIVLMTWLPRRMGISNGIRYVWLLLWRL